MATREAETDVEPDLDAYRFHEEDWDGYEALYDAFEWSVPDRFNAATYVCDRWADANPDRVAMVAVRSDGPDTEHPFGELRDDANRLANYLAARRVRPGDRIAVSGTQRVECLLAHLAAWKLGAVSVPLSVRFGPEGLGYRLQDSGAKVFVADPAHPSRGAGNRGRSR